MSEEDAAVVEEQAVEAEAEAAEVQDEEITETEGESESSTDEEHTKGVQKKIDKLTRNWRETERDRDYWREMALKNQKPKEPEPEPVKLESKTLADFDYDEQKYQDHIRQQIVEEAKQAAIQAARGVQTQDTREQRIQAYLNREAEFQETVDDYMTVTRNPQLPLTDELFDVVQDSEEGPAIAYYLGKNLNIAQKIATLPTVAMAREIGKIEAKIVSDRSRKGESVTKAPPPPPKLDGVNAAPKTAPASSPASDKLSTAAWLKQREKELAKRGRRP